MSSVDGCAGSGKGRKDQWFCDEIAPLHARLHRYIEPMEKDSHEREDIVQETFLRMLAMEDWEKIYDPWLYVKKVSTNLIRDRARRRQVANICLCPDPARFQISDIVSNPERQVTGQQLVVRMEQALSFVSPRHAAVIQKSVKGVPVKRIVMETGLSKSKVEKILTKARRAMIAAVADEEFTHPVTWPV